MRKFSILSLFLLLSIKIYSFDFSLGFNAFGFGYSFARGSDYKEKLKTISEYDSKQLSFGRRYSFSDTFSINARFGFHKYLSIETGLGYNIKSSGYEYENYGIYDKVMFRHNLHFLSVPVLFIFKYDLKQKFNIYATVGPKFNINLYSILTRTLINEDMNESSPYELNPSAYRVFSMDINIAVGSEYEFMKNQYVGLRLAYNVNVLGHFASYNSNYNSWKTEKYYVDVLSLSITYRYLFNKNLSYNKEL